MSVKRKTASRLNLIRVCGTCRRKFTTTADTPWVRQIPRDGKRQATTYFCSASCFSASYRYKSWYDGKAEERRKEREAARDTKEKNRRYYQTHIEQERERARKRYWDDPESARASNQYSTTDASGEAGKAGATDTYTITYTDGKTSEYKVYNGADALQWVGTQAEYEAEKDSIAVGTIVYITDDMGV